MELITRHSLTVVIKAGTSFSFL